jgi:hypothetical protein
LGIVHVGIHPHSMNDSPLFRLIYYWK